MSTNGIGFEMAGPSGKRYGPGITLTHKPDMITLDDGLVGQRAEMPCGHVIGPDSLTDYCRSVLSDGKFEFRCPFKSCPSQPRCNTLWDFHTVKQYAVLTPSEINEFQTKMKGNYLARKGQPQCPLCLTFLEGTQVIDQMLTCQRCKDRNDSDYNFCRFCLKMWLAWGTNSCGNIGCTGEDSRQRFLKDCPTKKIVHASNCPSFRACPSCGSLIEHIAACNQVKCPCGQRFCFICLTKAGEQTQCNRCSPAPIQTF